MTDKEIIKALECWIKNFDGKATDYITLCNAFDLINRQQAVIEHLQGEREVFLEDIHHSADQINEQIEEIERLKELIDVRHKVFETKCEELETAKSEAIKEFWSRLQGIAYQSSDWSHGEHPTVVELDDAEETYEEMVGEQG